MKRVPPAVSPLASPMESRRLFAAASGSADPHPQPLLGPAGALQLGYGFAPQPAKLLVDPQTGQQYFVPASPAPQPMSYFAQPLFYNQQPAFYPATAQLSSSSAGFLYPGQPPTTLWSQPMPSSATIAPSRPQHRAQSPPATTMHGGGSPRHHHQHSYSGATYRVEMPPSTVGSVCEEDPQHNQQQHEQQHFQRQHRTRVSAESRDSSVPSVAVQHVEMHSNPEEGARSPPPLSSFGLSLGPPSYQRHRLLVNPTADSTGGSSSDSTSGFASGRVRSGDGFSADGRSPPQSPLLREQRMPSPATKNAAAEEAMGRREAKSPKSATDWQSLPSSRMKAIRMDIDLNRPNSPPEQGQVSVRATVLRTAPPTAFTISFNDSSPRVITTNTATADCSSVVPLPPIVSVSDAVRELSLQEAAAQAPTGRRLMARRSVPPRTASEKECAGMDSGSEAGDPKRWLFRKMMLGRDKQKQQQQQQHQLDSAEEQEHVGMDGDIDDRASEAGTYVVEGKKMSQSQMTSSTISARRQRNSSSSTSSARSSTSTSRTPSPAQPVVNASIGGKRSLMNDLRRLREQSDAGKNQRNVEVKQRVAAMPKLLLPPKAPVSQRKGQQQPQSTASKQQVRPCRQITTTRKTDEATPFSRRDGGRFSMRPAKIKQHQPTMIHTQVRQPNNKQSPEMIAWLRRKEYDPRKAAVAAIETNQLKQQ